MSEHPLRVGLVGANAERSWAKVAHAPAERPSDDLDHGLVDVPSLGAQDCRVRPPLCG
jgi:predicted dehydrogenase